MRDPPRMAPLPFQEFGGETSHGGISLSGAPPPRPLHQLSSANNATTRTATKIAGSVIMNNSSSPANLPRHSHPRSGECKFRGDPKIIIRIIFIFAGLAFPNSLGFHFNSFNRWLRPRSRSAPSTLMAVVAEQPLAPTS